MEATGFLHYVKKAFLVHWNLLALGAASIGGIISGYPDVILPLTAAAEILFLASLATNKRFQAAMDAEANKAVREEQSRQAEVKTRQLIDALAPSDRRAFEQLKAQIGNLSRIAESFAGRPSIVGSGRMGGMNHLLWIYLKLLYSKNAVERFFITTNPSAIDEDIARAKNRLAGLSAKEKDSPTDAKRRASLEDQLKTCEMRLENFQRAKDNFEFIQDELGRLSAKISGLAEMAVARQDPNFISDEVDSVSKSVEAGEKAMSELDFLTGWSNLDETAPDLLSEQPAPPAKQAVKETDFDREV
jgi:hypothetical protein